MKFLVFNNKNGLGTADKLIVNWDSVKYIKPIDGDTFYIELNNGAYLEFDLSGANTSPKAIEAINRVVKANPNSRVLEVKPRSLTEFVFSNIQYRVAASGEIDGSGIANQLAYFTDTNTLSSVNDALITRGSLLTGGGGNPPGFGVFQGTSGQVLTSNGIGNLPSYQTLSTGAPSASANFDANGFGQLQAVIIEERFEAFQFGTLWDIAATAPDGHNEYFAAPMEPGVTEYTNPLEIGVGVGPNPGSDYSKYDIVLNPFKYSDYGISGGPLGWACGTVSVGNPQYIWNNKLVPTYGYSPTDPLKPTTATAFMGQVVCNNGIVPIKMAQYIQCDVSALGAPDLMGWVAYIRNYGFDSMNNVGVNKITIYFSGLTSEVTVV